MREKGKHLTYENRQYIENGLTKGKKYTDIAEKLEVNRRTIVREIMKHRIKKIPSSFNNSGNLCKNKIKCKRFNCTKEKMECYEEEICEKVKRTPYVCNSCEEKKNCRKIKYYYYSKIAQQEYEETLIGSREGINLTKAEIYELDKLIAPLLKERKQTISHIYATNKEEINFSKPTMYKYINLGILSVRNIDLPRKVKYKKRKNTKTEKRKMEKQNRKGRTYEDYLRYIEKNPESSVVQMDTVEGIKGGKVLLTILFKKSNLMLIYLMERKTKECVKEIFEEIKRKIGIEEFKKIFQVILTDNGSEFDNPLDIEKDEKTVEVVTKIFYCDACASWQKGSIERNHEYIRYVLPKGSSFDELTQEQVNIIASNLNSVCRDRLNGKTPYEAMTFITSEENIKKLGVNFINGKEVSLSPNIIK